MKYLLVISFFFVLNLYHAGAESKPPGSFSLPFTMYTNDSQALAGYIPA